jgi:hypothetical protein
MNSAPLSLDPAPQPAGSPRQPDDPTGFSTRGDAGEREARRRGDTAHASGGHDHRLHSLGHDDRDAAGVAVVTVLDGFSLVRASLAARLGLALGLSLLIWVGVLWATTPIAAS